MKVTQRVLNYILRPALPLKHLSYVEATGLATAGTQQTAQEPGDRTLPHQNPLPPPPALGQDLVDESQFLDCESQVPTGCDDWEAA